MHFSLTVLLTLTLSAIALPALAGFDWDNVIDVYPNVRWGISELRDERPSPSRPVRLNLIKANVTGIVDGDTIEATTVQQEDIVVQLACLDAPEMSQEPWGQRAKERLAALLTVGERVFLRIVDTDGAGRKVAEIYRGYHHIGIKMVDSGHAVVYTEYLDSCPITRDRYVQAEVEAKQKRIGFWSQDNPVMPWDYRQQ